MVEGFLCRCRPMCCCVRHGGVDRANTDGDGDVHVIVCLPCGTAAAIHYSTHRGSDHAAGILQAHHDTKLVLCPVVGASGSRVLAVSVTVECVACGTCR